ncbi:MAG: DUF3084 domain-containing protein [Armatimonadota bacterium]|jgi:uncharacterized protein (DUF3084 family)
MSLSEVSFIVALVATGGVVAWIGDIVGYRLGKRRVSLFGIRPRTTAILVGICSGALISIVTIAVLSLSSQHVQTALFKMDQLQAQLDTLEEQTKDQRGQIEEHKQAADDAEERRRRAEEREAQAKADVDRAEADIVRKRRSLTQLRADLSGVRQLQEQAEAKNQELEQRATELETAIERSQDDLTAAQDELKQQELYLGYVKSGVVLEDPIITAQEELARAAIDTAQPTPAIRTAVASLLEQASDYAADEGAQAGGNGRAVRYFVVVSAGAGAEATMQELPEAAAIDEFVQRLVQDADKSHAVRVIARFSAWREQQVKVLLDRRPNKLVFARGEVAGTIAVDGSWPDAQLWQAIMALLTLRVRSEAHARRMLTVPNEPKYGSIEVPEVVAAMEAIRARKGPIRVEAVVAEDTWTVGPLQLVLRLAGEHTDQQIGRAPDGMRRPGS